MGLGRGSASWGMATKIRREGGSEAGTVHVNRVPLGAVAVISCPGFTPSGTRTCSRHTQLLHHQGLPECPSSSALTARIDFVVNRAHQ